VQQNTPFRAPPRAEQEINGQRVIIGKDGYGVALVTFDEDAAFIVKACNSHDELVAALKKCAAVCAGHDMSKSALVDALEAARAALAGAE
jgi:hypothetical protein